MSALGPSGARRVLLLGWDGADWQFMRPLLRQGALPHLAALIDRGVSAELATGQPLVSPALWTSAMTGRPPEEHGVAAWSEPRPDFAGVQPTSSLSRKTKALWNIASQAGLATHAMGHFSGFPAESLSGVSIANRLDLDLPGAVHPADLAATLQALRVRPAEIDGSALAPFLPLGRRIDLETDGRPAFLASVLAETATQQARLTWVLENRRWDLATALFGGLAKITSAFGAYSPPHNPRAPAADFEIYRSVVDGAYRFFDMMLGAVMALAGPETTVLVMSVAGFRPEAIPPAGRYPIERTESWRRARGVLVAAGPGLRRGAWVKGLHAWGAASTTLSLLGLPVGDDMAAGWTAALDQQVEPMSISSWERVDGEDGTAPANLRRDPQQAYDEYRRMVELGYLDPPDEDHAAAMEAALRERRFNLARSLLDNGRGPRRAVGLLEGLVRELPQEPRFLAALGQAYFAVGRLADCRRLVDDALARGLRGATLELALASLDAESGRPVQALRRLEAMAGEDSRTPAMRTLQGRAYVRLGRWAEAEGAFEQALELDSSSGVACQGLALARLAQGEPERALEAAIEAAELLPLHPLSHYYRGLALARLRRWSQAEDALAQALELAPGLVAAHRRLAHVHRSQGDFAKAADCLWKAKQALAEKKRQDESEPGEGW